MNVTCEWCETPIQNPPESAYASAHPETVYCNSDCEYAERYHKRRERDRTLWWTHECPACDKPMFTPTQKDGWWCPECDIEEAIDKTGVTYLKDITIGVHLTDFDRECPNPECDSYIWLHDGAMRCHDCDVYFNQYGRVWWAMIEAEYPPKYTSWNERDKTEQSKL